MHGATLLFSFAHPDDESFWGAGIAMKYAAAGARTVLVCATRGERGTTGDPPLCAVEDLGACREQELRDAAAIIGFDELHVLDYRDRELSDAPVDGIRLTLVALIRRLRPAAVLTFDPEGGNRHPDHMAVSRFTTDAIAAASDPRWCPELGAAFSVPRLLWTAPIPPWDAARLDRLDDTPGVDFAIDVSAWSDRRAAALRAHRTQRAGIDRLFFHGRDTNRILGLELWRQGHGPSLPARPLGELPTD
ncbi:MAG TPA: PIG-L deacetylase family protein [Vicinamibacterales bacterium]|nr:PIG-L deacetylase family protein [Vicinamibacterales bacterium]